MKVGGGGGEGRKPPVAALLLTPFFARSLTLVPRSLTSLLLNRTETLATQATVDKNDVSCRGPGSLRRIRRYGHLITWSHACVVAVSGDLTFSLSFAFWCESDT